MAVAPPAGQDSARRHRILQPTATGRVAATVKTEISLLDRLLEYCFCRSSAVTGAGRGSLVERLRYAGWPLAEGFSSSGSCLVYNGQPHATLYVTRDPWSVAHFAAAWPKQRSACRGTTTRLGHVQASIGAGAIGAGSTTFAYARLK